MEYNFDLELLYGTCLEYCLRFRIYWIASACYELLSFHQLLNEASHCMPCVQGVGAGLEFSHVGVTPV